MKYILFDLDGTLLDFNSGEKNAFTSTIKEFAGYTPTDLECKLFSDINEYLFNEYSSGKLKRIEFQEKRFQEIMEKLNLKFDYSLANKLYIDNLKYQAILFPDVIDTLEYLSKKYELYIASNGMKIVQTERIKKIAHYFKKSYISEEVGFNKPDKGFFDYILKDINDPNPDEFIIIGDRLDTDILGGKTVNIKTVYLNRNNSKITDIKPDYEIKSLYEIKDIL